MKCLKLVGLTIIALMLVSGCTTTSDAQWEAWAKVEVARQERVIAQMNACGDNGACVVAAGYSNNGGYKMPQNQVHPAWNAVDRVLSVAVPGYFQYKQAGVWAGAMTGVTHNMSQMDRAYTNNSVNVGGNQFGSYQHDDSSNNSQNNYSTNVGGDNVGGNSYQESCVGQDCNNHSPYPNNSVTDQSNTDSNDDYSNTDSNDDNRVNNPSPSP